MFVLCHKTRRLVFNGQIGQVPWKERVEDWKITQHLLANVRWLPDPQVGHVTPTRLLPLTVVLSHSCLTNLGYHTAVCLHMIMQDEEGSLEVADL
jgi:hypothetical protein